MLLITICALLPAVSALPYQALSKRGPEHKVLIPYSVNCTSDPKEILIQTTPKGFSTVQSAHWPLLIGLKKSPVKLCGHNDWLMLNSIVSANASNSSFTTSSTFYDSDQALTAYLTSLSNATKANSTPRSLECRGVEVVLGDLAADATDWESSPWGRLLWILEASSEAQRMYSLYESAHCGRYVLMTMTRPQHSHQYAPSIPTKLR